MSTKISHISKVQRFQIVHEYKDFKAISTASKEKVSKCINSKHYLSCLKIDHSRTIKGKEQRSSFTLYNFQVFKTNKRLCVMMKTRQILLFLSLSHGFVNSLSIYYITTGY